MDRYECLVAGIADVRPVCPRRTRRVALRLLCAVTSAELVDAAASIDDLLLAGIKRMAMGAHFDL
ncbi:MAG TPA: hypothetical protein VNK45_09045 [Candidatus Acidoferrales bacterium]|nr:hypothetical protein [Candidatus Acidoferrales bacterium]